MQRKILNEVCHLRLFQKHVCSITSQASGFVFHQKYEDASVAAKWNVYKCIHTTHISHLSLYSKESSKIEKSVNILKTGVKKEKKEDITEYQKVQDSENVPSVPSKTAPSKPSLGRRILNEIKHYYHGFRLLFIDIKVSSRYVWKILRGKELTRREHRQLVRTVSDLFRLVPFSVFIIIPFMEFLLPVFLKLFPSMLPSTFQTSSEKEKKSRTQLKVKIEMAKFLHDTLDEMALQAEGDTDSHSAKDFTSFFAKIRSSGTQATNEEIMKFSKLFEDEITLDNLQRPSLVALCRLLELQPIGTNNFLRFQLKVKLRNLQADDQVISKEGIDTLNYQELQGACRARGMRGIGLPENHLRYQLQQWLELSLNEKISPSLLLLSRVLYIPENLPTPEQLRATLSSLPEIATSEAELKLGEIEGKIDNKTKLEIIKKEEEAIKKEAEELVEEFLESQKDVEEGKIEAQLEELAQNILTDKAPTLKDKSETDEKTDEKIVEEEFSKEDFGDLENALESIANEKKKLLIEKEEIEELKEEMADYKEDIEELKNIVSKTGHEELKESKAALRLSKKVNKMISKMDTILEELTTEEENIQQQIDDKAVEGVSVLKERDDIISISELLLTIRKMQKVSDDKRLQKVTDVLNKIDANHDGFVEVDIVLKVIDMLSKDNVKVRKKQMDEIIELMLKENLLKLEEKSEKQECNEEENVSQVKNKERQT